MPRFTHSLASLLALACLTFASCSPAPPANKASVKTNLPAANSGVTILVSVAASGKDVVQSLATLYSESHPRVSVTLNPGPSSGLATQIIAGAPADLLLSANREWADKVTEAGLAAEQTALLTNKLVIVVPKGNPAGVMEPQDLLSEKVRKLALAGENVPAGKYADQALKKLELLDTLTADGKIARGDDVRAALHFVQLGEAEAGIVYSTDARIEAGVETVYEFEPSLHDEIVYVLVLLKSSAEKPEAREFYKFLCSPGADATYGDAGFQRAAK